MAYGLASSYSVRALRVGNVRYNFFLFVDQSSSRRLKKFGEDIPTSPEVIKAHTLNFRPKFKFLQLNFLGDLRPRWGGGALDSVGQISNACKHLRGHNPLMAET